MEGRFRRAARRGALGTGAAGDRPRLRPRGERRLRHARDLRSGPRPLRGIRAGRGPGSVPAARRRAGVHPGTLPVAVHRTPRPDGAWRSGGDGDVPARRYGDGNEGLRVRHARVSGGWGALSPREVTTGEGRGMNMITKRSAFVIGALVLAVGIAAYFGIVRQPLQTDVSGTIGAADRYRS